MKFRSLLATALLPLLISTNANSDSRNYKLIPDPSQNISFPYPTERIIEIGKGPFIISQKNSYSDPNGVRVESSKRNIQGEILTPILNEICGEDILNPVRMSLEDSLYSRITLDYSVLNYFDVCFSDNKLSPVENDSLRLLLRNKTAIPFFIQEEIPTDNSFRGKTGYQYFPNILIFRPDSTYTDTTKIDSVYTKKEPPKKRLRIKEWVEKYGKN